MKKILLFGVSVFCGAMSTISGAATPDIYQLQKVVVLSRHGIRAPLIAYGSALAKATPQSWVNWQTPAGHLTPKGKKLDTQFAAYLSNWWRAENLLPTDGCPSQGQVLVYTNSMARTIESGQAFIDGAFAHCQISVQHLESVGKMDDTFNPILRAEITPQLQQTIKKQIDDYVGQGGFEHLNQHLATSYAALDTILDSEHSLACQQENICQLGQLPNVLTFERGKEPKVSGALRQATGAGDSFILQYYEGYDQHDVAWGKILTMPTWHEVLRPKDVYTDILFATPSIAQDAAKPLLQFLDTALFKTPSHHPLSQQAQRAKIVYLVGHDSNIASLLSLLKTSPYQLPAQYEKTPISGKVIFEQWENPQGKMVIKAEYVYQTMQQLRDGTPLNAKNPPMRVTLHFAACPTSEYCPMERIKQQIQQSLNTSP